MQSTITETEVSKALSEFYVHCPFVRIDVQDDYINYEVGISGTANDYSLKLANQIIEEYKLPLKAELTGFPFKHILHISYAF